jgi:hypothetical protein
MDHEIRRAYRSCRSRVVEFVAVRLTWVCLFMETPAESGAVTV